MIFVIDEDLPRSTAKILGALSALSEDDLKMSLTILEPGKIRSRKN